MGSKIQLCKCCQRYRITVQLNSELIVTKQMDKKKDTAQAFTPNMQESTIRWFYAFLLLLLIPLSLLDLLIKSFTRSVNYRQRMHERFGFVPAPKKTGGILIHCVSVGEVVAASKLIQSMLEKEPNLSITITTTTPTGSDRVRQIFGDSVHHFYLPYDLHRSMFMMLRKVKPTKVLITEVELWPNMIHACWRMDIPVIVINGRMTERSCRRYMKLRVLFCPMLKKVHLICAQGTRDFDNYLQLGLDREKLRNTGNIKFDLKRGKNEQEIATLRHRYNPDQRRLFVAGSTHDPEEKLLIAAFTRLQDKHPKSRLLLVPRHPQRFEKIWKMLEALRVNVSRSSVGVSESDDIVLIDEMGILSDLYGIADAAFIGGSISDRGGHNALEASAYGVPVFMGPNTYNNPEICQRLADVGALQTVQDDVSIEAGFISVLDAPDEAAHRGQKGLDMLEQNRGAIANTEAALVLA